MLNGIFGAIGGFFTWALANKQAAVFIILAAIIAWLSWSKSRLVNKIDELNIKNETLAADLKLKVNGNTVIYRDKEKIVKVYIPAEGGLIVKEPDANGKTVVVIKNKGFTAKPGIGLFYDGKVNGGLDLKLAYWERYSAGLGSSLDSPYVWLSRHVDDLVPVLRPQNVEFSLGYGKPYSNFSNSLMLVGIRTNF
jgi:hypothetical protein